MYKYLKNTRFEDYEVLDNGPGCGLFSLSEDECKTAATSLGYSNNVMKIDVLHAPYGCHVGHPYDNWIRTYFNVNITGQTGRDKYKSICRKTLGTRFQ